MPTSAWSWSTVGTAWAVTGWTRTRSSASTRHPRSTAWPRRCSATGGSSRTGPRPACTSERRRRRSAPTTPGCCASACWGPERCPSTRTVTTSATVSSCRGCPGQRYEVRGEAAHRRRPLPRSSDTGRHAGAVRRRRRRARRGRQRPGQARLARRPQYVIVGSGKTATDACIWLLDNGVDPDAICWVRPRDPWMLNRAVVQPDPAVFIGMAADTLAGSGRGGIAGRPVPPPGGRRGDAAHRPVRDAHHGEDSDARPVGARPVAHDRATSSGSGTSSAWSRPGWCSTRVRWRRRRTR